MKWMVVMFEQGSMGFRKLLLGYGGFNAALPPLIFDTPELAADQLELYIECKKTTNKGRFAACYYYDVNLLNFKRGFCEVEVVPYVGN